MEDPVDCVTGSPMADTCVRQVVPGRWGGEAVATEYVRSSRLFFTRRSGGEAEKGRGDVSVGAMCVAGATWGIELFLASHGSPSQGYLVCV